MDWLLPLFVTLILGGAATYLLRRHFPGRDGTRQGISTLAGMHWREFVNYVLEAMHRRGYEVEAASGGNDASGYFVLERDGKRWLLACKHGSAYVLGSTAIAELAKDIRLNGAAGGLLVTPGQVAPEARTIAAPQRIELLDGPTLWPEVRPLLRPEHMHAPTDADVPDDSRRLVYAWAGAVVAGLMVLAWLQPWSGGDDAGATAAVPARQAARAPRPPAAKPAPAPQQVPTDPVALQARRDDVASAISTLPIVDRAIWSTQSTLLVYLNSDPEDPMASICPLLERFDELRASRVQLQPPPGSERPVRFRQCAAY